MGKKKERVRMINLDPFNEFKHLSNRQKKNEKYLKRVRRLIDDKVSNIEIMEIYDMGFDVEILCKEKIKEIEKRNNNE